MAGQVIELTYEARLKDTVLELCKSLEAHIVMDEVYCERFDPEGRHLLRKAHVLLKEPHA